MEHVAIDERDPATILMEKECPGEDRGQALQGIPCLETIAELMKFSRENPHKSRTFELHIKDPEATQQQLASRLGIHQTSVHHHLADAKREIGHLILIKRKKK